MHIIRTLKVFLNQIKSDNIGAYAAQCAYFSFLSFIPFIILLLSLIKYINLDQKTLEYVLEAILPISAKSSVLDIIQEVYSKSIRDYFNISIFYSMVSCK